MDSQGELDFENGEKGKELGFQNWITGRSMAAAELARRLNLPLGHLVEVYLAGNIRLRGKLRLREEFLFINEEQARHLELVVDGVEFRLRELESCVRMD